jgi:hypothetical protein
MTPELLDPVALLKDRPDLGLAAGRMGTVVEVYAGGQAFEVEFLDSEGYTDAVVTLQAVEILKLHRTARAA